MSKTKKIKDVKASIKEFIRHVEELENEEDPEGNGFNREYRSIQEEQVRNRRENAFTMDAGKLENNLRKNRYKDILPYDDHRVILEIIDGDEESTYINASNLMGVKGTGGYIASQGPLASTVHDYWRMIWEKNVEIIFMACRIVELGKIKCKQYWNDVGKSEEFGDITVYTESEEEISFDFVCRKFKVTRGDEERFVTQFHYSGWPDHGIPDDPAHIRDLIGTTRRARHNDEAPLLVHCSAGCGRTGAIIAIDFVWTLLEEGRFDETFNLLELICNFRKQRMSIVQTADQYALVNKVLKSLCEDWIAKIASHTYVNVEVNQDQEYINIQEGPDNTNKTSEEENIYEDSYSMMDRSNAKEIDRVPEPSLVQKERLVSSGSEAQTRNNGPGPDIIELPVPAEHAPTSPAYENVQEKKKSEKAPAPAPPSPGGAQNKDKQGQLHKTLIKVGSNKNDSKQPPASDTGGSKDVTYIVEPRAPSRSSSTSSSAASSSVPPSPLLHTPSPTTPKAMMVPPHSPRSPNKPKEKGAVLPTTSETAVYSVVDKRSPAKPKEAVGGGGTGGPRSQSTSSADSGRSGSGNSPRVVNSSGNFREMSLNHFTGSPLPASPPGFSERLPKVKGPVLMPEGWKES